MAAPSMLPTFVCFKKFTNSKKLRLNFEIQNEVHFLKCSKFKKLNSDHVELATLRPYTGLFASKLASKMESASIRVLTPFFLGQ